MMIELAGVHFAHERGLDLLTEVELAIAPGEVVAVAAPAGAGATTLMRLLLGELTARGRVAFAGRDVARLRSGSRAALRRRLGVVPQDLGLIGRDTALANVALALEVCGVPAQARLARARALLAAVEVDPDLTVDRLAMAARQRVAWARAIVRSPDAVLADQPTSHQDADGAARFSTLVAERAELGAACLVLTRDPHLIAAGARLGWRMLALHRRTLVDVVPASADVSGPIRVEVAPELAAVAAVATEPRVTPAVAAEPLVAAAVANQAPVAGELEARVHADIAHALALEPSGPSAAELDPPIAPDIGPAVALPLAVRIPDIGPAPGTAALPPTAGEIDVDLDDLAAIPNVVPFPRHRSAGNRR